MTRFQSAEESEKEKDLDVRTLSKTCEVDNAGPLAVSGVGLVTGLSGTGGSPTGQFRSMLEDQLLKQNVKNVKQLLASPDNALVLVSALIPPGSRRGDLIDIDVVLPDGSRATSLRGGYLEYCILRDYEATKALNPEYKGPNRLLPGHVLAHARGPLLVGFGNKEEAALLRRGRIWGGGVSHLDRPFFLFLKKDQQFFRVANAVAQRINLKFQDDPQRRAQVMQNRRLLLLDEMTQQINAKFAPPGVGRGPMARATSKEVVQINVPFVYRFNPERYVRVVLQIPLQETGDQQVRYRRRLEKMLLDPSETVLTAMRLEALGKDSVPALKAALASEHALVRFSAAEALAYLGSTAGCEQLARLAEEHAVLRAYCLLALSSLEESICRQHLSNLLDSPDPELRCGAFQALRQMDGDEADKRLNGVQLNHAFWLHQLAPKSAPLVFFSIRQRAEIVLFGSDISLVAPVRILAGPEFTVTAESGDERCTITRFQAQQGSPPRRQCSLRLDDVLRTLADMGGGYPEAVDFLTKAEDRRCLSCPVRFRTLPEEVPIETLARGGQDPDFLKSP